MFRQPKEAETGTDDVHPRATGRSRSALRQDSLPRHLHARRGRPQDQPARIQGPGENSKLTTYLQGSSSKGLAIAQLIWMINSTKYRFYNTYLKI